MHVYLGTTWHNKCNLFRTERFKADTSSKPTVNGCLGLLQTKDSLQSAVVQMQIQTWLYSRCYPGSKVLVDGIDHSRGEVFAGQASWLNKFIVKKCSEKPKKPKFEFYFCAFCCTLRPSHHIDHWSHELCILHSAMTCLKKDKLKIMSVQFVQTLHFMSSRTWVRCKHQGRVARHVPLGPHQSNQNCFAFPSR